MYLSLGSNLGDRARMLEQALTRLHDSDGIRVIKSSSIYESRPWGLIQQPKFLNIIAEIETDLDPLELLQIVKSVEIRLGRKPARRWGPRCIDIDLILWGELVMHTARLTLPHVQYRKRAFVLTPLAEIAPGAVDPETGFTVAALAERLGSAGLTRYAEPLYS